MASSAPRSALTRVNAASVATWYAIEAHDVPGRTTGYLLTTPQGRAICNRPELIGCEYTNAMRVALAQGLRHAPFRAELEATPEHEVCVLTFLRGGLNFDLRGALHDAYGFNRHCAAFMSSQRSRRSDGEWQVREDNYRKLDIPERAVVLVGDVVATGVTVTNGLNVLLDHLRSLGSSLRRLIFFTIGCARLDEVLAAFDARAHAEFPGYEGSTAIYLEGRFALVDEHTPLRIGICGTDLVRNGDALLTPELEASQWDCVSYPLERCTIYDAGSRAFDTATYLRDVREYWTELRALAREGLTLTEAVQERWPDEHYTSFVRLLERHAPYWHGVAPAELAQLHTRYEERWSGRPGGDASALEAVCDQRLAALRIEQGDRS